MTKRRIGILTFHTAINYGAVLQAYALQQTLFKLFPDDEVKIIDFKTKEHIDAYKVFRKGNRSFFRNLIVQIILLPRNLLLHKRRRRFLLFIDSMLEKTERIKKSDDLLKSPPKFDVYLSGSDQVFNPQNTLFREYFLGFDRCEGRKVAYAPSCGISKFTQEEIDKIKGLVLDFDKLSCREREGAEVISDIVGYDVPVVLDPVFLLDPVLWNQVSVFPKTKQKYIFVYDLNGGSDLIKIAKKIANVTGHKIICQTQKPLAVYPGVKMVFSSGPKEFLGYIQGAEHVVTDSFHGTAFAILFKKSFNSYIATPHSSSRITNILQKLDLMDRIVEYKKANNFVFEKNEHKDYSVAFDKLKNDSFKFLERVISE